MSNVIQFYKKPVKEDECSFCNTPKSQTKKLFSNDVGKFICNVCVAKSKALIEEVS